jgi:hypothetical protein
VPISLPAIALYLATLRPVHHVASWCAIALNAQARRVEVVCGDRRIER